MAKVYGTITFILEHPDAVEAYLKDQDRILENLKAQYPMRQGANKISTASEQQAGNNSRHEVGAAEVS